MSQERLQKLIAQAGVTSRRDAETMIQRGRVTVNGEVVRELGTKADPEKDTICVDGLELSFRREMVVVMMHKPEKTVVTMDDPEKRQTAASLLSKPAFLGQGPRELGRVFPIGRLDYDAQGLLLFTNDGDLAQKLIHPRYHVPKTYLVKVSGVVEDRGLERIGKGILLKEPDGRVKRSLPAFAELHRKTDKHAWYAITVVEGRNHLIKRLFAAVGHPVRRILRIEFGGLKLGDLPEGEWRELEEGEEKRLREWASAPKAGPKADGKSEFDPTSKRKVHPQANGRRKAPQAQRRSGEVSRQRPRR